MPLSRVQPNTVVTVYYETKTSKDGGQKKKKNQVIGISFLQVNGKTVAEEHRAIFYCIPVPFATNFMAF